MAGAPLKLVYPFGGLSEAFGFDEQPPKTAREMRNMRGIDPKTGRLRGASRSGLTRFMDAALANAPVKRIEQITYDAPNQTYTDLGNALATVWSKANPSNRDSYALDLDSQSNLYVLDGAAGVVKYNSSGVKLFKIALTTDGKRDVCKALRVDPVTGFIYVGVSDGNKSEKGKLFCYRQKDDNETDKVFEVEPGGFVQQLRIYQRELYALLNFPDRGRAYIRVYGLINTTDPEQTKPLASGSRPTSFGPTLLICTATAALSECWVMPWPLRPVSVSTSTKQAEAAFSRLTPSQEKSLRIRSGTAWTRAILCWMD